MEGPGRAASAAGPQGLVALPEQVPPRPEEPGVLRALAGQLLHLGRHGRRGLQDLRQREGGLEGRQRGWGCPAPAPRAPRARPRALTSPICISTSSSSSRLSPPDGSEPSLPPRALRGSSPGDPSGTAWSGSGPASAMSRSALPRCPRHGRPRSQSRRRRAPPGPRVGWQSPPPRGVLGAVVL